jgi:ABC-2 type transport system permease protein
VAILFSILFRSIATSALAALAVWIFFSFFVSLGASVVADALAPDAGGSGPEAVIRHAQIQKAFTLISPMQLYTEGTATIIDPLKKTTRSIVLVGPMERMSLSRFSGPLPLGQSIIVVFPYIIFLVAITAICFAVSYMVFMRQEVRSV